MELDDLFGQGRNQQRHGYGQQYSNDDNYMTSQPYNQKYGNSDDFRPSPQHNQQYESKLKLINSMTSNPKIRLLLILAAVVIIALLILVIIFLFPLILKILGYVTDNGIQGILDTIWKGTK